MGIQFLAAYLTLNVLGVTLLGGFFSLLITDPSGDPGGPMFLFLAGPRILVACLFVTAVFALVVEALVFFGLKSITRL